MAKTRRDKISKAKTKKSVAKKTKKTKKTKTTKKKSPKLKIKNAKPEHYFLLLDGRPLRNLLELVEAMDEMTDEIFYHHVNEFRNDFATWTKEVFKEIELAEKLHKLDSKQKHQLEILKHMVKRLIK